MRTNNYKVHINQLVGKYMVRMSTMYGLIQSVYAGSKATSINIIIDLYSIKNSILGVDFEANGYDLCNAILDVVVHYKSYFRGLGVEPYFTLIDSNNRPAKSIAIWPNYNCDYMVKTTSANYQGVKANIELLGQICEYLPLSIQFIHSDNEVSVVAASLLEIGDPDIPTMIISRDMYVSMLFDMPFNLTWLYPSKVKGRDISWITDKRSARMMAFNKIYNIPMNNPAEMYTPRLSMSTIYAATKFPARGMRPLLQYRTLCSNMNKSKDIVWNLDYISKLVPDVKTRFLTLDIPSQLEVYRMSTESSLIKNPVPKKYDIEALKLINNDLFAGTLQLDELLR